MGYCCQATAQAWKTSCLGHCPPLPPTPTIFPHPPTLSFKEVLTTLALLFGPQNIPQPPIWLSAEKERAKLERAEQRRLLEGGGVEMGSRWQCGVSMDSS